MKKQIKKAFLIFVMVLFNCKPETSTNTYLRWVGDIEHNEQIDNPSFTVCNGEDNVLQYFNLSQGPVYKDEKTTIVSMFISQFKPESNTNENGLIRIRFIVNCEGKAGRFRVLQSDYNYNEKVFDTSITDQLLNITKNIEDWAILYRNEVPVDYYMYLLFKIKDGQITEILP